MSRERLSKGLTAAGLATAVLLLWAAPASADSSVALDLSAEKTIEAGKAVKLKASCGAEACETTAQVTYKVPRAGDAVAAASTTLKSKRVTKSVAAGRTNTLKLKLGGNAKRELEEAASTKQDRKRIKVIIKATATDAAGNRAKGKLKLKLE